MTKKRFEIGGEYSLDAAHFSSNKDNLFNRLKGFETVYFNTGRSAIRGVLRQMKGKRALLPAYICQSVIQAFEQEHYAIDFYNINTDHSLDVDDIKRKCTPNSDVFFVMHYYGTLQNQNDLTTIRNLCRMLSITIVEDTTHSILTKVQTIGDYCVASLRKWFALPDGGVAYSLSQNIDAVPSNREMSFTNTRIAGMFLKGLYLNRLTDCNATYRKLFVEAEKMIAGESEILAISDFSKEIVKAFDTGRAAQKRKENAAYLYRFLNNPLVKSVFQELNVGVCPFFYPLYVGNREKLRSYLNQNKIYCPVHWPIEDQRLSAYDTVRYISDHIISLPIDQRYSIADMAYLCRVINRYPGGNCENLRNNRFL